MSTVHGIRLIVSWNFKHLVNVRREDGFNAVNVLHGWPQVRIVSPKKLFMQTKTNKTDNKQGFDAVAASREWKAAVATATAAMSIAERMAWFRSQSSVPAIRSRANARGEKFQAHA